MDGPVDFTLDRARLMSAQSLGNYEGGYEHTTGIGRSGADLARVGTPSSLGQYHGRFIPPSLPLTSPGGTYMMNSFLNGGSAISDPLKTLMPDIQQYWSSAHGDGCATRYIVNNNTIYSPYLSGYLPATESLSLFAHNLGTGSSGQAQVNAYHRIYDLHKEALFGGAPHGTLPAALYGPVPAGISPPRITSESHGPSGNSSSVKKESRHGDSKRSTDNCKHSAKTSESHSKVTQQNSKHSREHEKKTESKKSDKNEKTSDIKLEQTKSIVKSDITKEASVTVADNAVKKQKVPLNFENNKDDTKTHKSNKTNVEVIKSKPQELVKHSANDDNEYSKEQTTIPTLTTVTLTSGESVTSPLGSPSSSASPLSPNSNGTSSDNIKQSLAQTSTTFSLPYYHAIYSHSQPSASPEVKKVHAPTFTPEIGTLPSVVSVVTVPVQTTACDMRIKKEKSSYSCCKEKCVTVMSSNTSPKSCGGQSNVPEKCNVPQKAIKKISHETKESKTKKNKSYNNDDSSVASVKPVSTGGNKLAVRPVTCNVTLDITKEEGTDDAGCDKTEKSSVDLKSSESSEKYDGVNIKSHAENGAESKVKSELKSSIKGCSDRAKNNVSTENSVSKQLSTHILAEKQEKRLLKIAPNVGLLDTLTKKGSDIKHQGRKIKVTSPERDVTMLKSSDFKRVSQSKQNIRSRDVKKGDNHGKDDSPSSGMNIPIGIAVAQKREELKDEGTDQGSDPQADGTRNSDTHHRTDGQPSAFPGNGPVITKSSSSPNASVTEMRNTLPANLIVTGSANGAGIAWSEDPSARHFGNPWLSSGHHPSSWVNQMPFTIPPNIPTSGTTDPGQLPVSVPPGYKLVQDSVTGQLMIIPATNLDVYDANRLWGAGFPSAGHPGTFQQIMAVHQQQTQLQQQVLAQHQERQPTSDYTLLQQYQQQFQHLYHPRQDVACSESSPAQAQVTDHPKTSKEIQSSSKTSGPSNDSAEKDKHPTIPSQPIQDLNIHSNQTLPYQYPSTIPIVYNATNVVPAIPVSIPDTISVKTEASTVQSRGTSPMVPASEIDDTSQETIDSAPSTTESSCDNTSDSKNVTQSIASVQTCVTDVSCCTVSVTSLTCSTAESVDVDVENDKEEVKNSSEIHTTSSIDTPSCVKEKSDQNESPSIVLDSTGSDEKVDNSVETKSSVSEISEIETSIIEKSGEKEISKSNSSENEHTPAYDVSYGENYNPFLDPQILQAADGLELLSTLAEKRAKCVQLEEVKSGPSGKDCDKRRFSDTQSAKSDIQKPKKKQLSRTRSVPAKCETKSENTGSYYTSTGLRIPQDITGFLEIGEEEINAIELDMRIRLAELQRLYKEKQRQLAKLHPKRDKEDLSKRGPGRPRKRKHPSSPEKLKTIAKAGTAKGKDGTAKKKKQAEELVDRVFRKTGGGFGMPLSKKLKANAMAALFKTQSGFTVKRKGSTSSPIAKSCDSIESHKKLKKPIAQKAQTSVKSSNDEKGHIKSSQHPSLKETSQANKKQSISSKGSKAMLSPASFNKKPILKKKHREENDFTQTKDNVDNGLGMLAKYATSALNDQPPAKKAKKKEEEETVPESSPDSSSSGNKKRKPGRPRKCNPNATTGVTETIVARNSKNFRFFQFQTFEDVAKTLSPPSERKPKVLDSKKPITPIYLDEEWLLRRSERIFLSEPSPQPSPNNTAETPQKSPAAPPTKRSPSTSTSSAKSKSEKAKLQKAKNIQELTQKVKRKYSKQALQNKTKTRDKQHHQTRKEKSKEKITNYESDSSSGSEGDNIPLSELRERPSTPEPRSCVMDKDELQDGLRVLVFKDGLFYEGAVQGIRPPDVYGVLIDNERGNRPHIYSREEILKEVIIDVKPNSCRFLVEGTRVCAYWSQQFSCLYPGTVAKASPNPHADTGSVIVEFDDGDSGRIPLDHIRMLTADFPVVSYDPNPLLLIGKRRRHTTTDSTEMPRKSQSSTDSAPKQKRGPGRPPKVKKEDTERESEEELEVDVCGVDEDHDDVFTSSFSMENFRKERAKSSVLNGDKQKVKKRKEKTLDISQQDQKQSQKKHRKRKTSCDDDDDIEDDKHNCDDDYDDDDDDDDRSSDQGKKYCNDKHPFVSFVSKAASRHTGLNGIESCDDDTNVECCLQSHLDFYTVDEDNSQGLKKRTKRSLSTDSKSKIAAFLPARQLWRWSGKCTKRPGLKGKAKKEFYKAIVRGKENIMVGDCAVFLSTGRPHLPYIGRIDSMWEAWGGQMVVKVKWFYHPEETRGGKKLQDMKGALFQSLHIDENDVQTISHKCEVLSYKEYSKIRQERKKGNSPIEDADIYYLAGTYEPTIGLLKFEKDLDVV